MSTYLVLTISVIACLVASILKKYCGSISKNKAVMHQVLNLGISLVCMISLVLVSDSLRMSAFTVGLGVAFGVITAMQSVFTLKAFDIGPYAYTSVITSLSTVIPAMSGYLFWNEKIVPVQLAGVVLMLLCFVFSVDFSGEKRKASVKWFVLSLATFFCTGFIGVMQKWHQNTRFSGELDGFLFIAFAVSTVCSLIMIVIESKKTGKTFKQEITPMLVIMMAIAGICVAANNKINLYLSGVMDSAVFFPVVNGGGLVLTSIASWILFKEALSFKKWIGIFIGIVAVLLLCNPF